MISRHALPLLLAGLIWQPACAAPLYKWRDSAGHVTYSSLPPPAGIKAEQLKTSPHPSAEDIRQAEELAKRTEQQASELADARRKQEAEEAEEAKRRALERPPAPVVIETPVYVPQPVYYPPVRVRPRHHHEPSPRDRPR